MNKNILTQIDFKSLIHMTIYNLKSVLNQLRTYSHWFDMFWLRSHDGQINWNRFQIDLKVSCEQGVYDKCEQGSELGSIRILTEQSSHVQTLRRSQIKLPVKLPCYLLKYKQGLFFINK